MPCNGPVVHPLPSCKFFFKEECWPKLEHNTVSKKQLLKRPCATKTLVYLEFQPQGGYFCSSNFPKFFCPIRLNRTPARNIYYKHIDYLCTFRSLIYIYIYIYMLVSLQPGVSISFFGCPSNLHWYLVCFWNKKCQYHGFPADICQFKIPSSGW